MKSTLALVALAITARRSDDPSGNAIVRFLVILSLGGIALGCLFYMLREAGRL